MADILTRFGVTYADVELPQTLTDGEGDSLANDIALSDEAQTLTLEVTSEQYTKLLSAALNGANRHYPNEYIAVIYPLIKAAKVSSAFCEAVAECISNPDSGTYDALQDFLLDQLQNNPDVKDIINGSGGNQSTPVDASYTALMEDCDLDNLFGFTKQLTQMMNTVIEDVYQKLEEKSNFLEALPIMTQEATALAYFIEWIEFLLNSMRDAYFANYDLAYENEIACDLFCLARTKEQCGLTWDDVFFYFVERIDNTAPISTLSALLTFMVAGSWSGTQFCDLSMLTFAMVMRIGASWSGIDLTALQRIVEAFYNDPDSDWALLCPCGWQFTEDFPETFGVFSLINLGAGFTPTTAGTTGDGNGLVDTTARQIATNKYYEGLAVECNLATPANITKVLFQYEALIDGNQLSAVRMYNGASLEYEQTFQLQNTGDTPKTVDLNMDVTVDSIHLRFWDGLQVGSPPGGSLYLPFVTLQGGGTIPPEFT